MLKISKNSGLTDIVSTGQKPLIRNSDSVQVDYSEIPGYPATADMTLYHANPSFNGITTAHPSTGSASTNVQLWLFNDDTTKYYTNINIDPTDAVSTDESTYVQLAPDTTGAAGTFGAGSTALTMANVGAAGAADMTGKPFWYKCTTPASTVQNKADIKLTINYTENAV